MAVENEQGAYKSEEERQAAEAFNKDVEQPISPEQSAEALKSVKPMEAHHNWMGFFKEQIRNEGRNLATISLLGMGGIMGEAALHTANHSGEVGSVTPEQWLAAGAISISAGIAVGISRELGQRIADFKRKNEFMKGASNEIK